MLELLALLGWLVGVIGPGVVVAAMFVVQSDRREDARLAAMRAGRASTPIRIDFK
jgi:hypothetical protein